LTTTDTEPLFLQVLPSVTVTVYVAVVVVVSAVGLTVCEAVVTELLQLYVFVPLALVDTVVPNTLLKPVQILAGVAVVVIVGKAFIVNGTTDVGPKQ